MELSAGGLVPLSFVMFPSTSLPSVGAGSSRVAVFSKPCSISRIRGARVANPQALTKPEFVRVIKEKIEGHASDKVKGLGIGDLEDVVGTVFSTITDQVAAGEDINIVGFGKFLRRYTNLS